MSVELTPKEEAAINEEIAEEQSEYIKATLLEIVDKGLGLMARGKPQERLAAFEAITYAIDAFTLLDTDYLDQRRAGLAQPLYAEIAQVQYESQAQLQLQAQEMGEDVSMLPPLEPPKTFWAECFKLPHGIDVAQKFLSDWKSINGERRRREEKAQPAMAQEVY